MVWQLTTKHLQRILKWPLFLRDFYFYVATIIFTSTQNSSRRILRSYYYKHLYLDNCLKHIKTSENALKHFLLYIVWLVLIYYEPSDIYSIITSWYIKFLLCILFQLQLSYISSEFSYSFLVLSNILAMVETFGYKHYLYKYKYK